MYPHLHGKTLEVGKKFKDSFASSRATALPTSAIQKVGGRVSDEDLHSIQTLAFPSEELYVVCRAYKISHKKNKPHDGSLELLAITIKKG
jgi:hypothetical protein